MTTLSASLRLRPTRIGFLVAPTDMDAVRRIIQTCTCLWGGVYNPIIPVSSTMPEIWKEPYFRESTGMQIAKGYLDFFEPDVYVEAESGLAAQIGLTDTKIDFSYPRVLPLDSFFQADPDSRSQTPFGQNIFDLYKNLYEREFKFVPRHEHHVALFESGSPDDNAFVEAAFGGFPKHGPLEPIAQAYRDAFDPEQLVPNAESWALVIKERFRLPLHFTRQGLKRDPEGWSQQILFVVDPTSAPDLIDLWNIRQFHPVVLPVNLQWFEESRDFLTEFIRANHRPLPRNPHGVMIHTTVQFGRSISEDHAKAVVEKAGLDKLPSGSWAFKFGYDRIWITSRDDHVWHPRRACVSAKSTDLELTVSIDRSESSVRFSALSPDFVDKYGDGPASWMNILKFHNYYGRNEHFALALPSNFIGDGSPQLRIGSTTLVSREGLVLPQEYQEHREYVRLITGREAIIDWLRRHDVKAEPSDPGRIADQVLRSLEGFWGVRLIADRKTLELLDKMAKSVRKYKDGTVEEFPDRAVSVQEWQALLARRANDHSGDGLTLDRFIKANILKLGISIQCPNCIKSNWCGIGNFREQLTCERCLTDFDFPQGSLDFNKTPWQYRVVGPFSVPDFAGGAYATVLALRVFAKNLGHRDSKLTYAPGLHLTIKEETPSETIPQTIKEEPTPEIDFTFWYQRGEMWGQEEEPVLVFGEAKSFAVECFKEKDVARMRKLANKFPGAFLVFAVLKETLSDREKTDIAALATWGREQLDDGRPRAPVIVLTGTELFSSWNITAAWKDLADKRGQFAKTPLLHLDNLWTLADLTQQIYLDLPDRYEAIHKAIPPVAPGTAAS